MITSPDELLGFIATCSLSDAVASGLTAEDVVADSRDGDLAEGGCVDTESDDANCAEDDDGVEVFCWSLAASGG